MNTKELLALARKQKADENTVRAYAKRVEEREEQFEKIRRQQAPTAESLARIYAL